MVFILLESLTYRISNGVTTSTVFFHDTRLILLEHVTNTRAVIKIWYVTIARDAIVNIPIVNILYKF